MLFIEFISIRMSSEHSSFDRPLEESYLRWLLEVLETSLTKMLKVRMMTTTNRLRITMKCSRMMAVSILMPLSRAPLFRFPTTLERGSGESNVNDHTSISDLFSKPSHCNYHQI